MSVRGAGAGDGVGVGVVGSHVVNGDGGDGPSDVTGGYCINLDDVLAAHARIGSSVHRTPVLTCRSIDRMATEAAVAARRKDEVENDCAGADCGDGGMIRLFFKVEAMQRTGSFKFRGALNAVLSLLEDERRRESSERGDDANDKGGVVAGIRREMSVVTHSSGNHAQALALAARVASAEHPSHRVNATIVMPRGAPRVKLNAVRGYGAEIVLVDDTNEAREDEAERISEETGAKFVHPSEDPRVIAGQGTAGVEFVEQVKEILSLEGEGGRMPPSPLDAVIIPVGGGGLASGNAVALRGLLGDRVKIILAEPEVLDDAKRSREAGELLGHDPSNELNSVADGLKTTLGPNTWPIVRDVADDVITVSEDEILAATRLVWERMKVCIEPSAGVGVAVALGMEFARKYGGAVCNVGVVLCGGNVDVVRTARLMDAMCDGGTDE